METGKILFEKMKSTALDGTKTIGSALKKTFAETDGKIKFKSVILHFGLPFITGFFFASSSAAFSSYPFAFALLSALCRESVFAVYGGTVLACIVRKNAAVPLFIVYTAQITLRILLCRTLSVSEKKHPLFSEPFIYRMGNAVICSGLFSIYRMFADGFLYYDMFGALFTLISVPVLCYLYSGFLKNNAKPDIKYTVGMYALCFSFIYSVKTLRLFGFSVSLMLGFIAAMYVAYKGGAVNGAFFGAVCGAACDARYALPLCAAGLFAGIFSEKGTVIPAFSACIASLVCSVYANGTAAFNALAPDAVASALFFIPVSKLPISLPAPLHKQTALIPVLKQKNSVKERKQTDTEAKLSALSGAMSSLSETFFALSDKRKRPGLMDIKLNCEACFEKNCRLCRKYSECWNREYLSTVDFINKLAKTLYTLGRAELDSIPEYMVERCQNLEDILDELNNSNAELLQSSIEGNKTEVFAIDYEQISRLISHAITSGDTEYEKDEELSEKVERYLSYMNIGCPDICVYGKRRKTVSAYGLEISRLDIAPTELKIRFERICQRKFREPKFTIDENCVTMYMEEDRKFSVSSARACAIKEDEKVSGDSLFMFDNKQDYFYALISDGMGSGKDAAISSKLAGMFLQKMLGAGNSKAISIEMLNHILREKSSECSATIDLLEIDLINGDAGFIKSGAAPSYILREGRLFNISASTMPLGIVKEINAEEIHVKLIEGDMIIMLSDGIAASFEDGIWVADLLSYEIKKGESLQSVADKILLNAGINNQRSDDMTVAILKIESNK